jgi:hypothetical protein
MQISLAKIKIALPEKRSVKLKRMQISLADIKIS